MQFKFLQRNRCPATMVVRNIAGIITNEYRCEKKAGHLDLHQSPEGQAWLNNTRAVRHLEDNLK